MNDRTFGRGAFLGIVGLGLAGLFYGRTATGALGSLVPDSVGTIVPTGGWRIYTVASQMPELDPASFRLRIDGLVKTPTTYTLADLRRMPTERQVSDFHCVTGWSVKNVAWTGVRFKHLLDLVEPLPEAHAIRFADVAGL